MRTFRDFKPEERRNYITLSTGEYYPDILEDACRLYSPVLETFSEILHRSESSNALFMNIASVPNQWMRTQLCRVFRKYVSPETPVDQFMLSKINMILALFLMKLYVLFCGSIKTGAKKGTI